MSTFNSELNWRYAVKKYDPSRKVSDEDVEKLKEAIRFSPSSMGLQPYRVLVISDPAIREKLAAVSFSNNDSIVNASHVFVFANMVKIGENDVNSFIENVSAVRGIPVESLADFRSKISASINGRSAEDRNNWTSKQTYIALGNLLSAAASLKIDSTPMEGFVASAYNEILGLDALGLNASVVATVGYRDESDSFQHLAKVRKPEGELFIEI